jgi:hypothetical protein
MLTQYKNINEIRNAVRSITGERISNRKLQFASYDIDESVYFNTEITTQTDASRIEMHVYSDDSWITGTHKISIKNNIPEYRDKITNELITYGAQPVAIDIYDEFSKLNLTAGSFRIAINFFKNLIGNYERQHLRIDEISPDRTEIRLRAIDSNDPEFLQQISNYINEVNQTSSRLYKSYLLNFSRNQCFVFVNSVVIGEYLYVKLYEPLPSDINTDFRCWVVEEQKSSYIDLISIIPEISKPEFTQLANPNWYANADYNISSGTDYQNWNDLLGSSIQTSQQIVDAYFSGSLSGIKLNIDFSDFNNFVFYSSATERLENFKYKLELLEYYDAQSVALTYISGSTATTNAADYSDRKTALISGFDAFEKFLYYESSSKLTTYDNSLESPTVPEVTGSYISPVPKSNSTKPYNSYSISSSQFQSWYSVLYNSASLYDNRNIHSLIKAVPEFIRFDSSNENLSTFVNMLGHHYDILYTYVNHMTKIHKREENPKLGMPNELLYSVAKQFGWNLTDGNQYQELWQYVLGTDEAGIPLTGSNTVGDPSVPGRDMTYAVWRRIVNNLPLLLKSKGTKRSVQALLSCYGIPQSLITIKEYGGPRLNRAPVYEKLNFDYALDLINTTTGYVRIDYTTTPTDIEFRFRTDDVITNPTMPSTMELFDVDGGALYVTIDFISGTKGTISLNGNASTPIEMFDGGWMTVLVSENAGDTYLAVKRSKYGKIVAETSATASGITIPTANGTITFGDSFNEARLRGQLQEIRLWNRTTSLDPYFDNHVKAPAAYNSFDAYNELLFRLPLTQRINHTLTGSLQGVQPVAANFSASMQSWSTDTPYDSIEETYYYDGISLAAGTYDDNKIRLENNELIGTLDFKTRAERSQFDKAPLDSKKLGVYFSPQTMIDEDIIAQLGFTELDSYIGDPGDTEEKSYPKLIQRAQEYWKKYAESNDINAYIKIFTLYDLSFFRQLEQLLPARADKLTGILIQPNILERSKDVALPKLAYEDVVLNTVLQNSQPTASGDYLLYLGETDARVLTLSANDDDQYQAYLTASDSKRYNGTTYSYDYLIFNGTTYITASTPYWRSEALDPVIIDSTTSEYQIISSSYVAVYTGPVYGSGSYGTSSYATVSYKFTGSLAQVQNYLPIGINNQRYAGSKLTSADFNIDSTQTVDGGPAVEWKTANPNQLIYQTLGEQGSFVLV